jgi:predicted nucleic acid-binding protein
VIRTEAKYILDTNLFIEAFRDRSANLELQRFHEAFAPFEYLSAVVAQELRAGVRSGDNGRKLERHVLGPFVDVGRLVTPSFRAWQLSGDVLATLAQKERLNPGRVTKAFGNDILLALSCREAGMTLVTHTTHDFTRIHRVVQFRFVASWPTPAR